MESQYIWKTHQRALCDQSLRTIQGETSKNPRFYHRKVPRACVFVSAASLGGSALLKGNLFECQGPDSPLAFLSLLFGS